MPKKNIATPVVEAAALDESGASMDLAVLEETETAFDPTKVTLDLTKAEKRRTTALLLAIQAYDKIIIKDAEYYNAVCRERDRNGGPIIQPATMDAMVLAAINFDAFIAGKFEQTQPPPLDPKPEQPEK